MPETVRVPAELPGDMAVLFDRLPATVPVPAMVPLMVNVPDCVMVPLLVSTLPVGTMKLDPEEMECAVPVKVTSFVRVVVELLLIMSAPEIEDGK